MEKDNPITGKRRRGGRPCTENKAVHRYCMRLTDGENLKFLAMFEDSGLMEHSRFLKNAVFNTTLKVVKVDKAATDYYIRLTNFYRQFQSIGNNYNQTVRAVKSNFGEKRGLQMLYKLEKTTIELIVLSKKIIDLTKEFEEKWLQK